MTACSQSSESCLRGKRVRIHRKHGTYGIPSIFLEAKDDFGRRVRRGTYKYVIGRSVNLLFSASLLYFSHIPKTTIVHVPLLPHYGHTFINMVINCNNIFLQTDIKVASPIFQVFPLPPEVMSPARVLGKQVHIPFYNQSDIRTKY